LDTSCTKEERDKYTHIFKEFQDVFSWSYNELKEYDKSIFQHIIPMKEGAKHFKQKLRTINPKIKPLVKIKIEKLEKAGIISPIRHLDWISSPVEVRKNTGEIYLCVYFRDLNKVSIKDSYPLPNTKIILQQVTGSALMSMLDGFSGYNQVIVVEEDRPKRTFVTPWGTYAYIRIPFGFKNAGATFLRAMDHAFKYFVGKSMVDYQYDLTIYSKSREIHLTHLRHIFEKCRIYGISLIPKKCLFSITEGNFLGHAVRKQGIYINPEIIKETNDLNLPP
jgi:hypothetical protein